MVHRYSGAAAFVALVVAIAFALPACKSNEPTINPSEGWISDVVNTGPAFLHPFAVATSPEGKVALVWQQENELKLSELNPGSSEWSKPQRIVELFTGEQTSALVLGYDGTGRLLVAWDESIGVDDLGRWRGWAVRTQLRDADGRWQRPQSIARLRTHPSPRFSLSTREDSFVISWYPIDVAAENRDWAGFRILDGSQWLPRVEVENDGPLRVELLEGRPPLVLWINIPRSEVLSAVLRKDRTLGEPQVIGEGSGPLSTASDGEYVVAAWVDDGFASASVWDGRDWTQAMRFADHRTDVDRVEPLATAIGKERAAVVWFSGYRAFFSINAGRAWTRPRDLSSAMSSGGELSNVGAGTLPSGETVLLGLGGETLELARVLPSNKIRNTSYSVREAGNPVPASSGSGVAFAWEADLGWESHPEYHIFVWVTR